LATTCNKNEKQQDAKNNVEFYTKLTKKTWKCFEDAETGLPRPNSWRNMMTKTEFILKIITISFYEGWNFNSGNYLFTTDTK